MTTARDLMHEGAQCVGENQTLLDAAKMMSELDVGAVPVCGEDDRLKGIITDRDIVVRCFAEGHDPSQMKAGSFAEGEDLFLVTSTDDADAVVRMMGRHQIRRVPVIEDKRLVGMISEADLAKGLPESQIAEFVASVTQPTARAHT